MSLSYSIDCKLFRGAAGAAGSQLVNEITRLNLRASVSPADATLRTSSGWTKAMPAKKSVQVTFTMTCACTDVDFVAFRNAFFTAVPLALLIADGAGSGVDADFLFTGMDLTQDISGTGIVTATFTAVSTSANRNPQWFIPSGSEPPD